MKISKKIITSLKKGGVNFYLSVPCKLLANMIEILIRRHCQDNGIAINDNLESNGENSNG